MMPPLIPAKARAGPTNKLEVYESYDVQVDSPACCALVVVCVCVCMCVCVCVCVCVYVCV